MEEYTRYLSGIWENSWLTNHGPLVQQLEKQLKDFLGVEHLLYVTNGNIAIQLAIKALELNGEIITTPFSYVATTNSVLWENCKPVFADIDPATYCINPNDIEKLITSNTSGILATHVYGNACDVEAIQQIATKHHLKIIYDGAHSFGVNFKNESILNYGDASTLSFHATKLYHTIEGGAIITKDKALADKLALYRSFGHMGDDYYSVGINGKNSEFHAAMGLANLPHIENIMASRRLTTKLYQTLLNPNKIHYPEKHPLQNQNYSYFPVLLESEQVMLNVRQLLLENNVGTRRYFYPSLNTLPFLTDHMSCPVSEDIASRVLCLPLYFELPENDVKRICQLVNACL